MSLESNERTDLPGPGNIKMKRLCLSLGIIASTLAFGLPAHAQLDVPISVEGGTGLDACAGIGVVAGLKAGGDGFLAVRAGPGSDHAKLDELVNGDLVSICDEREPWLGIVYAKAGRDCGVSSPWPRSGNYTGPCPSGWVHRDWVRLAAG